jgi:hypothetical protein
MAHYNQEFKDMIVQLHLEHNRTIVSLADKYGIGKNTISNWLKTYHEECEHNPLKTKEYDTYEELAHTCVGLDSDPLRGGEDPNIKKVIHIRLIQTFFIVIKANSLLHMTSTERVRGLIEITMGLLLQ